MGTGGGCGGAGGFGAGGGDRVWDLRREVGGHVTDIGKFGGCGGREEAGIIAAHSDGTIAEIAVGTTIKGRKVGSSIVGSGVGAMVGVSDGIPEGGCGIDSNAVDALQKLNPMVALQHWF